MLLEVRSLRMQNRSYVPAELNRATSLSSAIIGNHGINYNVCASVVSELNLRSGTHKRRQRADGLCASLSAKTRSRHRRWQ